MNKKGFTLVELLAVVVVLGLIITITATKGFGAFNKVKDKIEVEDSKMLFSSLNNLLVEVENCDDDMDGFSELKPLFWGGGPYGGETSCEGLKSWLAGTEKAVDLTELERSNFLTKEQFKKIKKESDGTDTLIRARYNTNTNKGRIPYIRVRDRLYFDEAFTSNNQGKHDSIAYTSIQFTTMSAGKLSFDWSVSSEKNYDKLNVILYTGSGAGEYVVNGKSGVQNGTFSKDLNKNTKYKIEFKYSKNHSQSNNADTAIISNLNITSKVTTANPYRTDGSGCNANVSTCYYFDN